MGPMLQEAGWKSRAGTGQPLQGKFPSAERCQEGVKRSKEDPQDKPAWKAEKKVQNEFRQLKWILLISP